MHPTTSPGARRPGMLESLRIVAGFSLGCAVLAALTLGWMPAASGIDMHVPGAVIGGLIGATLRLRRIV